MAGVEDDAIARFQRGLQVKADTLALDPRDLAQEHAALLAEAGMDKSLVIGAVKPPGVEPAREGHFHVVAVVRGDGPQLVEGLAVDAGDVGDVFGGLKPPLDLQRGHAHTNQLRQDFQPGQVLRAEQILPVAERH